MSFTGAQAETVAGCRKRFCFKKEMRLMYGPNFKPYLVRAIFHLYQIHELVLTL